MAPRLPSLAFWVVFLNFLLLSTFACADEAQHPHGRRLNQKDSPTRHSNVITKAPAWAKEITFSPAHQNPAEAPAVPVENIEVSEDAATSLKQYYKDSKNTYSADPASKNSHNPRSLEKRGPLYCKDGPCIDGSIALSPSCAHGGGSTNGRTIGHYQSWNVRTRKCNTKTPKQLNTKGFTHLFYSFALIDPKSFKVVPAHDDDPKQMREFTALSKGGQLQTWIAIGGFDFSNEKAATHTTWRDMVSTKENRAAFIAAAREYMDEYGFQGIDLDWKYPGEPKRGGRKLADTRKFAMLLREMRAEYGTKYGISLTLAPDYWSLRRFDAQAMEPYVDFFGFMAYDLHGSWDEDTKTLGSLVRGQADIREISNNTVPLWFDGLDPTKINFGVAMYGRGYTLSDKSCNSLLCPFKGPSKKGECTDTEGVMSLGEIESLIKEKGIKSTYLKDSMMKQITWDDQWIGYDDEETFKAKKAWADGQCFGGTMIWSIDLQAGSGGSGGGDGGTRVIPDQTSPGKIPDRLLKIKLPECTSVAFDEQPDMGKFWYDSGAQQWADEYISSQPDGDHTDWAQNLLRNLFGNDADPTQFSCQDIGAACVHGMKCQDFNDIDKGGLFYLFVSMANFHKFMSQLSEELDKSLLQTSNQIGNMRQSLNINSGSPEQPLKIGSILAAAFGIGSAMATPYPLVGGPLAGLAGIMALTSACIGTTGGQNDAIESVDTYRNVIAKVQRDTDAKISTILAAVFGKFRHRQTDIPPRMRQGGERVKNPAVSVFGWGSWLKDHALEHLKDLVDEMKIHLDQALFWQMARQFRGIYVVVRDDLPVTKCTAPNNYFDTNKGRCLDVLAWYPRTEHKPVGANTNIESAWNKRGMDKATVLRNAVDCWEGSGGKAGDPELAPDNLWPSKTPPRCLFAVPVVKGNHTRRIEKGSILLAGDFAGQQGQAGKLWPLSKCRALHQCPSHIRYCPRAPDCTTVDMAKYDVRS